MSASPTIDNTKILYYGTQANYDAIVTKDSDILYFCTDSKKIFKGSIEMTEHIIVAATKPVSGIVTGKLYVIQDTGTVEFYNGSAWTVVSYPLVTSVSVSSDDVHVPSAKAVYDYVQGIVAGDSVVTNVVASETAASIDVTIGDNDPTTVTIPGVVTTPTYTAATRTFTFPVTGGDSVVVELGKDIFIDKDANNRYEDGYLYLYLNDGTQSTDPTEIAIPVTSLVTDYFGDDTDSVSVDVDNSTHKVTATVRVRPDSSTPGSEFENLLKVSSTTGAVGLYVDRTPIDANTAAIATLNGADTVTGSVAYAVKELADGAVATNTAAIATLNGDASTTGSVAYAVAQVDADVQANTQAIATLNGDDSTTGSVAYAVKPALDAIEVLNGADSVTGSVAYAVKELADGQVATNTAAIATLNGDASTTGSVAYAIANVENEVTDLEENKVDVNAANITVLANAQGWGTF